MARSSSSFKRAFRSSPASSPLSCTSGMLFHCI
uniref:Kif4, putative n=1 Tax=Arundo donax TaxID=35708 RepID=A0A0A9CL16_ARUDO